MIPVASDVHKGRCWMAMIPPGEELKNAGADRVHAGAWRERLAELPPEAEIALEVSTSGYFVMSVLEERDGGSARTGCTRRGSTVCASRSRTGWTPAVGEEIGGARCRPTTRGLVSAASDPGLTPLARQRCGLAGCGADEEPRAQPAGDARTATRAVRLHQAGTRVDRAASALGGGSVVLRAVLSPVRFSHEERKTSEAELEEAA